MSWAPVIVSGSVGPGVQMTQFLAALILYTATVGVVSGLLFLPAASIAESLPPSRPARESLVWFAALGLPHVLAVAATAYAVRMHALDPVAWALRDARVRHVCFRCLAESPDATYRAHVVSVLVAGIVLVGLLRPVLTLALSWRDSRLLARTSRDAPELGVRVTPLETPWSACVGFLPSRVYVTEGLTSLLDADELEAVIAHESAHARRRDNLRLLLAQALFGPTITIPSAHASYRRLRGSLERAADERALQSESREGALASALVAAARKLRESSPAVEGRGLRARLAAKHRDDFVAERVRRAVEAGAGQRSAPRRAALLLSSAVLAALLIAGVDLVQPTVRCLFESVLTALSGGT